ncbi:MAG: hypothetical protein DHS20C01_18190 [marine bacterium B5-7]|nr:MAG: hypothetical protein DHS20C01_18190 [marine bacterium B5-7]
MRIKNLIVIIFGLFVAWTAVLVNAQEFTQGEIIITRPWARISPPGVPNGAVYLTITLSGSEPDRLISAKSDVSDVVEFHSHEMENGMMRMRKLDSVELTPDSATEFAPGGLHVMLIGLKKPLASGETFTLTIEFERNDPMDIEVVVSDPDNS